ncbi:transposon Tf2-1 polyprotein [Trifolium pratense]|uniref:Transposon Tf2-1 polyprotein n=1 Tax=Trifolium pratense TaxID=57577 RepID=A0A2K3LT48_TRIPR|nr:transposon Tf2-1 polyprotein [Trifolium pratense]
MAKLLGFDFEVIYKVGVENKVADALSRKHEEAEVKTLLSYPIWTQGGQLQQEIMQDPVLKQIVEAIQSDPMSKPGFTIKGGILFYKNRLVISAKSPMIDDLLKDFHSSPSGGHSGYLRTYRRMAGTLYWQGMMKRVQEFIKACDTCQRQKYAATTPSGLLQPLPIPGLVWSEISMDFITNLPKSNGYEAILVVVDRLSKYSHFVPLKHPFTARSIASIFVKEIVRLHGVPESILSDRDPLFVSIFWKELFKLLGTVLKMSSAYHPQTDGQTEVVNRCLESYLRCFIADQPKSWAHWIPWAELWYNTTFHISTGFTPFEVVYGRKPPVLVHFLEGETRVEAVAQELRDRDEALRQLKFNLQNAQAQMKVQADKKRKDVKFEVGDWVFLKLRPHRQQSVVQRIHQKLAPRFFGPYQIIKKVGSVAYKLQLPTTSKIHPTFHVSQLKKAVGNYTPTNELPASLEVDKGDVSPAKLLSWRDKFDAGTHTREWLVQWEGMDIGDATWEEELLLKSQFPDLCLEDKAVYEGGSDDRNGPINKEGDVLVNKENVKPKVWRVYERRIKKRVTKEV